MTRSIENTYQPVDSLAAERCIVELQRGREVVLQADSQSSAVTLVETLEQAQLQAIQRQGKCQLVLTANRAMVLGRHRDTGAAVLNLSDNTTLHTVRQLAGLATLQQSMPSAEQWQNTASSSASAGIGLALQAHALPAILHYAKPAGCGTVLSVTIEDALHFRPDTGALLELSRASIPLTIAERVELVVFKERHGAAEHVAVTVGKPDMSRPVVVRLHSSCFTGDILGSLRCDCGEQLNGAIRSMASMGGGIVLYVSQEGRGIGLASKLRAYQLQEQGLDTIEANQFLGFGADERRYQAAATMLHSLGVSHIRLMTNNPLKIDALRREGVDVVGRLPAHATVNVHNARYLQTKRERAGHMTTAESLV